MNFISSIAVLFFLSTSSARYRTSLREREYNTRENLENEYGEVKELLERIIEKERLESRDLTIKKFSAPAVETEKPLSNIALQRRGIGETVDLSDKDKTLILKLHNDARAALDNPKPASPLPKLVWDDALESIAKGFATSCKLAHNLNRGNVGENIYFTSAFSASTETILEGGVRSWNSEKQYWTYPNICNAPKGKSCGHYTQVIWNTTNAVGCSLAKCSSWVNIPWDHGHEFVCNYREPGNFYKVVDGVKVFDPPY